jgi:predicted  nucleic acid-binding Zn ribbon protein
MPSLVIIADDHHSFTLSEILHSAIDEWADDGQIIGKRLKLVLSFLIN